MRGLLATMVQIGSRQRQRGSGSAHRCESGDVTARVHLRCHHFTTSHKA